MLDDCCVRCFFWDYVDDTGSSEEKMCFLDSYDKRDIKSCIKEGHIPKCYNEEKIKRITGRNRPVICNKQVSVKLDEYSYDVINNYQGRTFGEKLRNYIRDKEGG